MCGCFLPRMRLPLRRAAHHKAASKPRTVEESPLLAHGSHLLSRRFRRSPSMNRRKERRYAKSRYRKVMIWPRVQMLPGEKVVALVPLVIPLLTAHATAWA